MGGSEGSCRIQRGSTISGRGGGKRGKGTSQDEQGKLFSSHPILLSVPEGGVSAEKKEVGWGGWRYSSIIPKKEG